jgi:hypothetical protein
MNNMDLAREEKEYLWAHFAFNADQRLKAFNFFVVFSVFANGGAFTAVDKCAHPVVMVLIGTFICILSIVFFVIDLRSQRLLRLATPGLKEYEKRFPEHSRLFAKEQNLNKKIVRYSVAFRVLFVTQFIFGIGVFVYGLSVWIN